jgi:hypothetical protein
MTNANPTILTIDNPTNFDRAIESLRSDLSLLPWLEKSFGRAWTFTDTGLTYEGGDIPPSRRVAMTVNSQLRVPKVYLGAGEYWNVLPNDALIAQSFMATSAEERWVDYQRFTTNAKERNINVIFWMNLKRVDETKDYIFTEELKKQVEVILRANPDVKSINSYFDEKPEDVFQGYDIDRSSQFLMYPYAGFRFNITIGYFEDC